MTGDHEAELFDQLLRERRLRTVFQPVVHLDTDATVGYEALVRGPEGSVLESADALLKAAYRADRVVEFDWVARACACREAFAGGLDPRQMLFMNIEPLALDSPCPPDLWDEVEHAFDTYPVVLEVTERSLERDPGTLLDGLERHRQRIAGFALDDTGSTSTTLSMLPLVAPAVIKLDLRLTQGGSTPYLAEVLDLVYEEVERTGATVLAEGIETQEHADFARSLGLKLGQGYLLGRPLRLSAHGDRQVGNIPLRAATRTAVDRPFDAVGPGPIGRAKADVLHVLAQQIEESAGDAGGPALFVTHLPAAELFDERVRRRLATFAGRGTTTAVLGPGIPAEPGDGIRGAGARHDENFVGEWAIVALSASTASALLARAVGDGSDQYDFGITHDKQRVIAAARCLCRRLGEPLAQTTPSSEHDAML